MYCDICVGLGMAVTLTGLSLLVALASRWILTASQPKSSLPITHSRIDLPHISTPSKSQNYDQESNRIHVARPKEDTETKTEYIPTPQLIPLPTPYPPHRQYPSRQRQNSLYSAASLSDTLHSNHNINGSMNRNIRHIATNARLRQYSESDRLDAHNSNNTYNYNNSATSHINTNINQVDKERLLGSRNTISYRYN